MTQKLSRGMLCPHRFPWAYLELEWSYPYCKRGFQFLGAFAKLPQATMSFGLSVHPSARTSALTHRNNSAPTERIFVKFDICVFSKDLLEKIQVSLKSDKNNGHFFKEDQE
jgi:hypothetical protein